MARKQTATPPHAIAGQRPVRALPAQQGHWPIPTSDELLGRLRSGYGVDLSRYRAQPIRTQISRRMEAFGLSSLAEYLTLTSVDLGEFRRLLDAVLVGSTSFFREPSAFSALRTHLIEGQEFRHVSGDARAWVAGCSTGQEAYSVAMVLLEALEARGERRGVRIFATDVRPSALRIARRGWYPAAAAQELGPERLARFFVPEDGGFRVSARLRDAVIFGQHDLLRDPPYAKLDLVSCRNLLMYLDRETQGEVLQRFHFGLQARGTLMLGAAESTRAASALFLPRERAERIYCRATVRP